MKITIIYDNNAEKGLESDWGFSCLIENKHKILFDTGANGRILLSNMKKLGIDPKSIDEVFISHSHFDHTGGLAEFLNTNDKAKIYIPQSFRGVKNREVIEIKEPKKIHDNIYSTGELYGIEQSIVINTEKGLVIIVGCSHPGVDKIIERAKEIGKTLGQEKIYAVIGGYHGFSKLDKLKEVTLIGACHCTQYKGLMKEKYPDKFKDIEAGSIIEI
jgi:7,8-dihydropterin-6-yl-methyl-4-(beta-D-ribofuranosyl)aminobenzene 5'-phosphate synthase